MKKFLKYLGIFVLGYAVHLMIEGLIVANVMAYLGVPVIFV